MSDFIDSFKDNFNKVLEHLKSEINNLRIGRATPSLVENIKVDSYGTPTPLMHLAGISVTDPKTIQIQPWDKNLLKEIEKGLQQADLGTSPLVKESFIIISLPSMTEESRKEVIKKLSVKLEEARISIRNNREKIKEQVNQLAKDKGISEDDKFRRLEELDELVKAYNKKIKDIGEQKEKEIMTV
ncbi:MAG TPA: ribosome recycling factor [Patescibacteria group bacterium]|nr:ribosome recycling factor [Patescibacteria group bacterium]